MREESSATRMRGSGTLRHHVWQQCLSMGYVFVVAEDRKPPPPKSSRPKHNAIFQENWVNKQ